VLDGPIDGLHFLAYVEQILAPTLKKGQIVFLDNVSTHKIDGVEEAIAARGALAVFLPAYSPSACRRNSPAGSPISQKRKRVPQALVIETALASELSPDGSERIEAALKSAPMGAFPRIPRTPPTSPSQDRPSIRNRQRSSLVRNRKLEICTSGSVRGEGGDILTCPAIVLAAGGTQV